MKLLTVWQSELNTKASQCVQESSVSEQPTSWNVCPHFALKRIKIVLFLFSEVVSRQEILAGLF